MSKYAFKPNVELFDADGDSCGLHRREGSGASRFYTDEHVWHHGGRPVFQSEIEAWGWTARDISAVEVAS